MEKFSVIVKTKSKKEGVFQIEPDKFEVRVNVLPIEGRANKRIIELLSKFLGVPKSKLELINGEKSKIKVFKIT